MKQLNLSGQRFGRLIVNKKIGIINKKIYWLCICICGKNKKVRVGDLRSGRIKSCGCLRIKIAKSHLQPQKNNMHNLQHGMSYNRFYKIYYGILSRCKHSYHKSWKYYGGRGIKNLWDNFEHFKKDMYRSYLGHIKRYGVKQTTIDRIDPGGHYSKENCRWATYREQVKNQRQKI